MARVRLSGAQRLPRPPPVRGHRLKQMPKYSHLIGCQAAVKVYALGEVAQLYELAQPQLSSAPALRCRRGAGAQLLMLERQRNKVRDVSSWWFAIRGWHRSYGY